MTQNFENNEKWKINDIRYINELQKMFDIVDNVKDEELKNRIIIQFLKCDKILTELAKEQMKEIE